MTLLEDLTLWHCDVTASAIGRLGKLKRLRTLAIDSKRITDDDLTDIDQLQHLEHLTLNRTQLTDRGLEPLLRLPRLQELSLEGNRLTDAGLVQLKRRGNLRWLDLTGCTEPSPSALEDLEAALPNCLIRHNFEPQGQALVEKIRRFENTRHLETHDQ